jgi:hypothetical protein
MDASRSTGVGASREKSQLPPALADAAHVIIVTCFGFRVSSFELRDSGFRFRAVFRFQGFGFGVWRMPSPSPVSVGERLLVERFVRGHRAQEYSVVGVTVGRALSLRAYRVDVQYLKTLGQGLTSQAGPYISVGVGAYAMLQCLYTLLYGAYAMLVYPPI